MNNIIIAKKILKLAKEVIALDHPDGKEEGTEFKGVERNDKPNSISPDKIQDAVYFAIRNGFEFSEVPALLGLNLDKSKIMKFIRDNCGRINEAMKGFDFDNNPITITKDILHDGNLVFRMNHCGTVIIDGDMKSFVGIQNSQNRIHSIVLKNFTGESIPDNLPAANNYKFVNCSFRSLLGIPSTTNEIEISHCDNIPSEELGKIGSTCVIIIAGSKGITSLKSLDMTYLVAIRLEDSSSITPDALLQDNIELDFPISVDSQELADELEGKGFRKVFFMSRKNH